MKYSVIPASRTSLFPPPHLTKLGQYNISLGLIKAVPWCGFRSWKSYLCFLFFCCLGFQNTQKQCDHLSANVGPELVCIFILFYYCLSSSSHLCRKNHHLKRMAPKEKDQKWHKYNTSAHTFLQGAHLLSIDAGICIQSHFPACKEVTREEIHNHPNYLTEG